MELYPDTRFLVTPAWDPSIDQDNWDRFLVSLVCAPHTGDEQLFITLPSTE